MDLHDNNPAYVKDIDLDHSARKHQLVVAGFLGPSQRPSLLGCCGIWWQFTGVLVQEPIPHLAHSQVKWP